MPEPNQLSLARDDIQIAERDLLRTPAGARTADGLRDNIRFCVTYIAARLNGQSPLLVEGLVVDAAVAELAQAEIWRELRGGDVSGAGWQAQQARAEIARAVRTRLSQPLRPSKARSGAG